MRPSTQPGGFYTRPGENVDRITQPGENVDRMPQPGENIGGHRVTETGV